MDFPIKGSELSQIRKLCGYSARELGAFMGELGIRPTSARRIYAVELMPEVPLRCAIALEKLVGKEIFTKALLYVRKKDAEMRQRYEEMRRQREERAAAEARMKEIEREQQ